MSDFLRHACQLMFASASDKRKVRMLRDPLKAAQWPQRTMSLESSIEAALESQAPGLHRHQMVNDVVRRKHGGRNPWEDESERERRLADVFQGLDEGLSLPRAVTESYKKQNVRLYRCKYP